MENKPMNILIDSDMGGDVDDALALALALNSPEVNIVGVTTVYLESEWRANVTRNLLRLYGREDIPVSTGASKPFIGNWDPKCIPNSAMDFEVIKAAPVPDACDFIIERAKQYGQLTIVAIGPLTNIGLVLAKAPELTKKVDIIMMGGQLNKAHPEWNILCDPEAARIVVESGAPIKVVGLDVTTRCGFDKEDIESVRGAGNPRAMLLADMMDRFTQRFGFLPVMHDPLTIAALFWKDVITFEEKKILIETAGQFTRGLMIDCDWGPGYPVRAAVDVQPEEFKKRLISRLIC